MDLDPDRSFDSDNLADCFDKKVSLESDNSVVDLDIDDEDDEDVEDEEFEFSFNGGEIKSPVSAEDVFHNGQIRATTPFIADENEKPVKNVFVVTSLAENDDVVVEGPVGPEMSRKSNSTGFSRLRKMKDLLVRSNSDGKDTFVFLTKKETASTAAVAASSTAPETKKGKKKTMMAAYESFYGGKNKEKKGGEKSYLPYKVGFFTNVNSMTKNVHPY